MNTNRYLNDDDLALYALRLLTPAEASEVEGRLAGSSEERDRLARIELSLGAYAECAVELREVPQSSADRFLQSISGEKRILQMPAPESRAVAASTPRPAKRSREGSATPLSWLGWAIAAALLVTCGWLAKQRSTLAKEAGTQATELRRSSETASALAKERDGLRRSVQEQAQQVEANRLEAATHLAEATKLRTEVAGALTKQQQESARAAQLADVATANARERDILRGTVNAQANQVSQLSTQAANARQVLDALTDRTALRVSLTVPQQKPSPTGRGTYVAGNGTLIFTGSNLAPLKSNKVYELWLMPSDGSKPIPAGTFVPDAAGNASLVSTQFTKAIAAKGFAVTVENDGGSLTPTLPIILAGV